MELFHQVTNFIQPISLGIMKNGPHLSPQIKVEQISTSVSCV